MGVCSLLLTTLLYPFYHIGDEGKMKAVERSGQPQGIAQYAST